MITLVNVESWAGKVVNDRVRTARVVMRIFMDGTSKQKSRVMSRAMDSQVREYLLVIPSLRRRRGTSQPVRRYPDKNNQDRQFGARPKDRGSAYCDCGVPRRLRGSG